MDTVTNPSPAEASALFTASVVRTDAMNDAQIAPIPAGDSRRALVDDEIERRGFHPVGDSDEEYGHMWFNLFGIDHKPEWPFAAPAWVTESVVFVNEYSGDGTVDWYGELHRHGGSGARVARVDELMVKEQVLTRLPLEIEGFGDGHDQFTLKSSEEARGLAAALIAAADDFDQISAEGGN